MKKKELWERIGKLDGQIVSLKTEVEFLKLQVKVLYSEIKMTKPPTPVGVDISWSPPPYRTQE